ncbi:unnamed protein product [Brassica oleracea]
MGEQERSGDGRKTGEEVDAGALFVLKSKGTWWHCGFHLTTSIVAPPLLSLPCTLSSSWDGPREYRVWWGEQPSRFTHTRSSPLFFNTMLHSARYILPGDMAHHILGPKWGTYYVGPIQMAVCYGVVIANTLLGGQCLKAIYLINGARQGGNETL